MNFHFLDKAAVGLFLIFALAACGEESDATDATDATGTDTSTQATETIDVDTSNVRSDSANDTPISGGLVVLDNPVMEQWTVNRGEVTETSSGPKISLEPGGAVLAFDPDLPVRAGDIYEADVTLDVETPGSVTLRIVRFCGDTDGEQGLTQLVLEPGLNSGTIRHEFERDHGCARLTLVARDTPVVFTIEEATLRRIESAG